MKLAWYIIATAAIRANCDYLAELVSGCSSKCDVSSDKLLTCFNSTLEYYEKTLFGIMRNYIAAQLNLAARSPNHVGLSREQMVSSTLAMMSKVHPLNIEDEKGVLTIDGAKPIVEALVESVLANFPGIYEISCPEGCEQSSSPWKWWFTASAVVNVVLAVMAFAFTIQSTLGAKKMLKEAQKIPSSGGKAVKQN